MILRGSALTLGSSVVIPMHPQAEPFPFPAPRAGSKVTENVSPRSLRRAYLDWVEEQVEAFKDSIPRSDILRLADEVVTELRVSAEGQYQLTELLLCTAIDRRIVRMLKLPGYRAWCAERRERAVRLGEVAPPPPADLPARAQAEVLDDALEPLESVA